jgi:hypothetical protein
MAWYGIEFHNESCVDLLLRSNRHAFGGFANKNISMYFSFFLQARNISDSEYQNS